MSEFTRFFIVQLEIFSFSQHIHTRARTVRIAMANGAVGEFAGSEGPDQPAHPRSLINAFTVRLQNT